MADDPQRFTTMLTEWLDRRAEMGVCTLTDPESEFIPWVERLVHRYYYRRLMMSLNLDIDDFVHECVVRLLGSLEKDPPWIITDGCNDAKVGKFLLTTASRLAADCARKAKSSEYIIDGENTVEYNSRVDETRLSQHMFDLPDELCSLSYEIEHAQRISIGFMKSFENEERMVATYSALVHYCDEWGLPTLNESRHWLVLKLLLRPPRQHLPDDVTKYLQATFPDDKSNVISQRITLLKKKLKTFLKVRNAQK